ncbi:MAG: acyl-CoA/acyl-ACP dehydrogenase [Gammaproteobacteria bacterium]|nr:acyl-CoA/acyl-ACP dehydrogenase [Gammaproteobacteria bacterium]
MNFEFSQEQNLLREQARGFLDENCPPSSVRKILEGTDSFDEVLWKRIAELGWLSTVIPQDHGGLGMSYYELSVIAEELGRALAPVPFSSSVYLATEALLLAGSTAQRQKWLPRLASGESIGTFALSEQAGRPTPSALKTSFDGNSITGTKIAVPDGDIADFAVVVARSEVGDGATVCLVELDDVATRRVDVIDPSRSHAELTLEGSQAELLGSEGTGWSLVNQLFDRAAVLFAWEQVGGCQAALDQAKDYALNRYAFGRPIGGFQAIKHKLANVYVKNTLARSNCYYGAWALAGSEAELPLAAATARVSATQAFYFASKENIQTHGGMGFTWEFDCQLYYRRAKLLSVGIGSEMWWQDRLVAAYEQSNRLASA